MREYLADRTNWTLVLALLLGLGLALGLTTWVSAQDGPAPNAVEAPSGTSITVNTVADELNSDGDCSLREALQAANTDAAVDACPAGNGWDTIMVPAGTYVLTKAGSGEDANATGDLDVLDSVTILGASAGTTIFDGNNADRVLHVDPTGLGVALDLRDVTVTKGSSDAGGGLRAANGLTRIQDSVFRANSATGSGGAIQADLGTLRVLTSTIENNDAGASGQGGGIYVDLVALTIQGSTIENNTAQEGAGLYNYYGSATVQDTDVIRNTTVGTDTYGAGIYSEGGNLIIEAGSEIAYNHAETTDGGGEGGGIWVYDETRLVILDSWVHHNESDGAGGGVYADGYGTYVRDSIIEYNTAGGHGGGFHVYGDLILVDSRLQFNHSADTSDGGGGVYAEGDYAGLVISNTLVYSNTTDGYGGGVYLYEDGGLFVANSIFRDNQAKEWGGGIYLYEYAGLIVEDSSFEDNGADYGGAIYSEYENGVTVERSIFSGNRAISDGGALYLEEETPADIRNSTFSRNQAGGSGGAIYINDDVNFGIQSSTIVSNSAGTSGGGIYALDYATAQNSIIAGNSVGGNASAADADCDIGTAFYSGGNNLLGDGTGCGATRYDQAITPGTLFVSVLGPLADNGGPALPGGSHPKTHALLNGSPAIDAANDDFCPGVDERGVGRPKGNACDTGAFESNFSAVVPAPSQNIIAVTTFADELNADNDCSLREAVQAANTDTAVDKCKAGAGWDTISLPAGTYLLTLAGASEDANASGDLDIITQSVTIRGAGAATTIIDGNDTDRVLDVLDEGMLLLTDVTVTNGNTTGKTSSYGGCIQSGKGLFMLLNSVVAQCFSPDSGGGIEMEPGVGRLVNTVVKENSTLGEGGGLYNDQGTLSIQDSTIMSNTAEDDGGGVNAYYAVTRISAGIVQGNVLTGTSDGGGIYHYVGNLILDKGTRVMYNTADSDGGGIDAAYGAIKIEDSTISHNSSSEDGGGISLSDIGLWLRDSLVEYNTAGEDGGGANYASGLIENSTIRYNEASTMAGGLETWSIILNSTIANNKAAEGGGIWAEGVGLFNTVVKDNTALGGDGGGMYIQSSSAYGGALIVDSTFSGNKGRSGESGSGVYAETMPVTARGSTFSGNSGADSGGAIYSHEGVVDLLNSTVSGNSATDGAGIYVLSGTVFLNYSTVANNTASSKGGGIYNAKATAFENSIVAGNRANGSPSDASADCEAMAPITFGGYSLFGNHTGCAAEGRRDQTVVPATVLTTVLGPLADNGGPATASGDPTWTHALPYGSPALDVIPPGTSGCQSEVDADQRSISRPQGANCDVGAFEVGLYKVYLPFVPRRYP